MKRSFAASSPTSQRPSSSGGLPRSGFHLLRHTFATQYLKNGGDVVRLSIVLGHSEISTTMKYLHLLTEDLQKPYQSLSILNRLR